jgi:hypothetical protein
MKSILTEYTDYCLFCGRPTTATHHLLFGRGIRPLADRDGLTIPICDGCHNMGDKLERIHDNPMAEKMSKIIGQLAYEKRKVSEGMTEEQARESFRKRYSNSYL